MVRDVGASQLRWRCPVDWIPADSTARLLPSTGIIGQARAVRALEFGLAVPSLGFNVFATGLIGTGRMTAIELHLKPLAASGPTPDDLAWVADFDRPERPALLRLRAGSGAVLRDRLERFIHQFRSDLPALFESEEFQRRIGVAVDELKNHQQEIIHAFERKVREAGFSLVQVQVGSVTRPEILPVVEDRPVTLEKLQAMAEAGSFDVARAAEITRQHETLTEELGHVFREAMAVRAEMIERAEALKRSTLEPILTHAAEEIVRAVDDPRVAPFLAAVAGNILADLDSFTAEESGEADPLVRYRVNVVVDNGTTKGRPVVIETEPSFTNLFGTIEARVSGDLHVVSDHTRIRGGSLLRANGGFLVVNGFDAVAEPGVWPALKRALRYRRVVVRPREMLFAITGNALQPEPVELDVKVVMLGDRQLFDLLNEVDEDFRKIFKVLADFDSEMPCGRGEIDDVLRLMAKIIRDEKLPHLDRSGMAALIEESVRLAGNRGRLSARFSDVADILREAAFAVPGARRARIDGAAIRRAVLAKRERHSLPEEKIERFMLDGVLNVATSGSTVGQINGLAVYDLGYHAFGVPDRVTARVAIGRDGVVNIEREARLSGPTHDKGVLILSGFLRGLFAQQAPLSMTASVAFEQSYGGVDGDSASSTEIYAILSALSGLPLRQDIAVTGSVDQTGLIQAIGGVNEKIEGFYRLCAARHLTGTQGVMIPATNVADLQLDPDVAEAVEAGSFHVWAGTDIAGGIELLTGVPAGERGPDGRFAADTVYGRCAERLAAMAAQLRAFRAVE